MREIKFRGRPPTGYVYGYYFTEHFDINGATVVGEEEQC